MKTASFIIGVGGILLLIAALPSDGFADDVRKELPSEDEFVPLEKMPEMIRETIPVYPEEAKKQGIVGKVYLRVLVDKDGDPVTAKVSKSSGNELLDQSALDAAGKNKFSPGIQDGQPVAAWVIYTVDFVLGEGDTPKQDKE